MQASKIIPGSEYAVKRGDLLLRFRVTEVNTITKRKSANRSPHDSHSEVVGSYVDGEDHSTRKLSPDDIAGLYTEFKELVEKKDREIAAAKAKDEAQKAQALDDRLALYAFVGVTAPEKTDDYAQLFRAHYGEVTIRQEGLRLLVDRIVAIGV